MAYWLLKTEPSAFSFTDLERDRRATWDGVRNNLALKHMREVRSGDQALIYHTGAEKAVVGIARIASDPYPDPQAGDTRIVVFDLAPQARLKQPVTLAVIKSDKTFAGFELVRMPRLSVMPVQPLQWRRLLALAKPAN